VAATSWRAVPTRLLRLATFMLFFLPVVGAPAALTAVALQLWAIVTWPMRALMRLVRWQSA